MIRGGTGQNARIREEAKRKIEQDREWLLAQVNELLAREAERDVERNQPVASNPNFRPDETDDVWASRWDKDWEQSQKEYDKFLGRR